MTTAPERPPDTVGVKVTLMEQVARGANVVPQFVTGTVVTAKSPDATTLATLSVPVPVLVRTMLRAVLVVETVCCPKSKLVGLRVTMGAAATPVPDTADVCGLPVALSTTLSVADRAPGAVGLKMPVIVQASPDMSSDGQLLVWLKSPGFVPV